jgi:hypothetical protein
MLVFPHPGVPLIVSAYPRISTTVDIEGLAIPSELNCKFGNIFVVIHVVWALIVTNKRLVESSGIETDTGEGATIQRIIKPHVRIDNFISHITACTRTHAMG